METIKKKICLEAFKSRQKSSIPFVGMEEGEFYASLNWGKIPYSVNFSDTDYYVNGVRIPPVTEVLGQEAVNKYGVGVKTLGVMTFSEIMEDYHLVVNNKATFPDNEEDFTPEDKMRIERLRSVVAFVRDKQAIDPSKKPLDICCYPCQTPTPNPAYDMDTAEYYANDSSAYVNLCLVQSANIIGAYTFATKDWIPGRRYFEGDKVIYDGKTYKLKKFANTVQISGSAVNCGGQPGMVGNFLVGSSVSDFVDYPGLSEDIFVDFTVKDESEIVDMGYIYARKSNGDSYSYYVRPSWGGYYNKYDGETYFDVLVSDYTPESGFKSFGGFDTKHWEIAEDIISHGTYHITTCGEDVHMDTEEDRSIGFSDIVVPGLRWESKLTNFIRRTKTVSDDGVEVQGKLNKSDSTVADLIYMIGTTKNVDTTCDVAIGDFLADITVIPYHQSLISIYHIEEVTDGPHEGSVCGQTYTYTNYSYVKTQVWEKSPEAAFKGSINKSGNSFIIYNEWSEEVFNCPEDLAANDYKISVTIGEDEIVKHAPDYGEIVICGVTVQTTPGKLNLPAYSVDFPDGNASCNGTGFTITPEAGDEDNFDVKAPGLLAEYGESGEYVHYQDMDTYKKLVENWAGVGETGFIIFKYYMGAEVELCENSTGEEVYVYNGGDKRLIYTDTYPFIARSESIVLDDEVREFVYLGIDYDYPKEGVVYENINYEDDVIKSDIVMRPHSMTEGGEPVSENFQNADYFMEDYQLGLSFVANNNENVYIDRGTAAAFERHMRLSEVDTMQDLENYGNGMFKLKE